jgi:hypothetical protein
VSKTKRAAGSNTAPVVHISIPKEEWSEYDMRELQALNALLTRPRERREGMVEWVQQRIKEKELLKLISGED